MEARCSELSEKGEIMESWPSGRRRTPGKCVDPKRVSRVRIPNSPPLHAEIISAFCYGGQCPPGMKNEGMLRSPKS